MNYRVIFTTPSWHLNGVNSVSATLARGLRARGIPAEIVLTRPHSDPEATLYPPADIPVRSYRRVVRQSARLRGLASDLEANAPCVFLPGYDYHFSGISSILSDGVVIVGVVHSDEPLHYAHVARLGRYWNAIVCVSHAIERRVKEAFPELSERTLTIHNGVELPEASALSAQRNDGPLEVVFAGRVEHHQKRILDLPNLLEALERRSANVRVTVIGGGVDLAKLRERTKALAASGRVRFTGPIPQEEVLTAFERAHVFLLLSDFEGLPISLLEAMARRCIPVVTDIPSGIPEVVEHGVNGFRLPIGDMIAFAETLGRLATDLTARAALAEAARQSLRERGFSSERMSDRYQELFAELFARVETGQFRRPVLPRIVLPPEMKLMNRLRGYLGHPVQRLRMLRSSP